MTQFKCSLCKKAMRKNQSSIFCDIRDHWVHAECAQLGTVEFKKLCDQDDSTRWCCPRCILDAFPFQNINNKDFSEMYDNCTDDHSATNLDAAVLSDIYADDRLSLLFTGDDSNFTSYYFSEDIELLLNNNPINYSLIAMHINIRSLRANFGKLQSLLSDMKLKPHIISINETWLKPNQTGEFNSLLNYCTCLSVIAE